MSQKWSWFCTVVLVFGIAPVNLARAYEYVTSGPSYDYDSDDSPDSSTSTHIEESDADGDADEGGYCWGTVLTYTWAKDGDSASADGGGWGSWSKSWDWNGPPGTAPGGTLDWVANGSGDAYVDGSTDPGQSGGASASASASSYSGGGGSGGSGGAGTAWASGSVEDDDPGSIDGNAYTSHGDRRNYDPHFDYGSFWAYAWWVCNAGDSTSIPSGTSSVYFGGIASASGSSDASAGPVQSGAEAGSGSSADADVNLSASLY